MGVRLKWASDHNALLNLTAVLGISTACVTISLRSANAVWRFGSRVPRVTNVLQAGDADIPANGRCRSVAVAGSQLQLAKASYRIGGFFSFVDHGARRQQCWPKSGGLRLRRALR